jgi:peptidoglycan/xylan/chitin deacetylase (PgdA/CDA1 family)
MFLFSKSAGSSASPIDVGLLKRKAMMSLQRTLHYTGAAELDRRFGSHEGFIALMYHSIPDTAREPFVDPQGAIPAELFEQQLEMLKAHCNVVPLSGAVAYLKGEGRLPERAVVVTFDDGYLDNFEVAAPLMKRLGIPATLFIATGYVDRQEPQWIDELHALFRARRRQVLKVDALPVRFDLSNPRGEKHAYLSISMQLLMQSYPKRRRLLDEVRAQLDPQGEMPRLTLSWDELRTMQQRYPDVELGLHTHDHTELATLPLADALAEVRQSQQRFRDELGSTARFFSYPYGRTSPELTRALPGLGIEAAFITQPTERVTVGSDAWAMPRYEVTRSLVDLRLWSEGALPELGKRVFGRVVDRL